MADYYYVYDGEVVSGITLYSSDYMNIRYWGIARDTTVGYGGTISLTNGGIAEETTVNKWGYMYIYSGGIATNIIASEETYLGLTIGNDTIVQGTSNGIAFDTTENKVINKWYIVREGFLNIIDGGVANNTTVSWGGEMSISSGGVANSTTVLSSGTICGFTLLNSQYFETLSGGITNASINSAIVNGYAYLGSDGVANNTTINSGGRIYIYDGGVTNETVINSYGYMYISNEGIASSTIVNSNGDMYISSGGVVNETSVLSGGSMIISSGGVATNIIASEGAYLGLTIGNNTIVQGTSNGIVFDTTESKVINEWCLERNGFLIIIDGGVANNTTVNTYGKVYIASGGIANSTIVNSRGYMDISSGGVANETSVLSGGSMFISSGGVANNIIASKGAYLGLTIGNNTIVHGTSNGIAFNTTESKVINNWNVENGVLIIVDGGVANSTTVSSVGSMTIASGGIANNIVAYEGAYLELTIGNDTIVQGTSNGIAFDTTESKVINNWNVKDGNLIIVDGGIANSTTVVSGHLLISSGGVANDTIVSSWGGMYISNGGVANSTTVVSGSLLISSGGVANNTWLYDQIIIYNDGIANSTYVVGGTINISSGGVANYTYVLEGDIFIFSGGVVNNTTIDYRGVVYIGSSAIANDTIIRDGGQMFIYNDGIITGDLTIESGAIVSAYEGAIINFDVTDRSVDDSALLNNYSLITDGSEATYTITVDAYLDSGSYALADGADSFDNTITIGDGTVDYGTLNVGDTLTYGDFTYELILTGSSLTLTVDYEEFIVDCEELIVDSQVFLSNAGETYCKTTINSGGFLYVMARTTFYNTTINDGGALALGTNNITAYDTVVNSGGTLYITNSPVTLSNTVISSGGIFDGFTYVGEEDWVISSITSGYIDDTNGVIDNCIIESGNTGYLTGENDATNTTIYDGATMYIGDNNASGTIVSSGGLLSAGYNSIIDDTSVLDGGSMYIDGLASAFNSIISSGGSVTAGGNSYLSDCTIYAGGSVYLKSQVDLSGDIIISGGLLSLGGTTSSDYAHTVIIDISDMSNNDVALVENIGYLKYADIYIEISADQSYGSYLIATGSNLSNYLNLSIDGETSPVRYYFSSGSSAYAYNDTLYEFVNVDDNITLNISKVEYTIIDGTIVNDGEYLDASAGIIANDSIVNSGGSMTISQGGIANDTIINDGGTVIIDEISSANNTVVSSGGFLWAVTSNAFISNTTVYYGGHLAFTGKSEDLVLYGSANIYGSTGAYNNIVHDGGSIYCYDGGSIYDTTISSGGAVTLGSSSYANNTIVEGGAYFTAWEGAAENTTVNSGGSMKVISGSASSTTIESGGMMEVTWSGTADDTAVASGGTMIIYASGEATDVSNDSGEVIVSGTLTLTKATTLDTVDITGGTMVVTTDEANIGLATVVTKGTLSGGSYGMILGEATTSGVTINLSSAQVSSLLAGAGINSSVDGDIAVNITGESSTEAWTANIFGGGAASEDITITGTTTTTIEGGSYSGLIYGGSYAQGGAEVTSVGDTTITVIGITQTNNPVFTTSSSAWIVGAGQALSSTLTAGDIYTNVYDSTVGYIVGGARAEGDGVANIENITITVENSTVTNNIFGSGYTNGTAQVSVSGDVNIIIDSTESATIQGDIYLGGNNVGGLGSITVTGDGTVTFTGDGDCLSFTGLVSGLGKGNSTFEGSTSIEFSDFSGEFSGTITDIDEINFSGNGVMTMSNSYEVSTIGFDLTERTELDLFLTDSSLDLVGDERVINLTINEGEFNYNLMDVSDEDLTGVICKVFDTDGTELGSFDLLEESLALGSYEVSFDIDDNGVLTVKSEGTLA